MTNKRQADCNLRPHGSNFQQTTAPDACLTLSSLHCTYSSSMKMTCVSEHLSEHFSLNSGIKLRHSLQTSLTSRTDTIVQWRTQEFCSGGVQQIQLRTEDRGSGGGSHLVRGSGGSCNLVQEISFQVVKFLKFWYFKTIYDYNQFICHC